MFDIVDTPFSYVRGLIVCSSLQEFSKTKESTLHVIRNVDAAFLLSGAELTVPQGLQELCVLLIDFYFFPMYIYKCTFVESSIL